MIRWAGLWLTATRGGVASSFPKHSQDRNVLWGNVPINPVRARRTWCADQPRRRGDQVHGNIVRKNRQLAGNDLKIVNGGGDHGVLVHEAEVQPDGELEVGVAAAFAQP